MGTVKHPVPTGKCPGLRFGSDPLIGIDRDGNHFQRESAGSADVTWYGQRYKQYKQPLLPAPDELNSASLKQMSFADHATEEKRVTEVIMANGGAAQFGGPASHVCRNARVA